MSEYGLFASVAPTAAQVTQLYAVPAGKKATARVVITNRGAAAQVRLSIAVAGVADSPVQYLIWDEEIGPNSSLSTAPITLNAADVVRCYSSSGNVNFHFIGILQEI